MESVVLAQEQFGHRGNLLSWENLGTEVQAKYGSYALMIWFLGMKECIILEELLSTQLITLHVEMAFMMTEKTVMILWTMELTAVCLDAPLELYPILNVLV